MHSSPAVPTGTGCKSASTMWIWVFAIGLPMGTNARSLAGSHAHQVTSTAASVGPYRLWSPAGSRSKNRSWSALGSASPLQMTLVRPVQSAARGSSRNSCSIDGTKWIVVIPRSTMTCAR